MNVNMTSIWGNSDFFFNIGKPDPDSEGVRILEYALAYDLFLGNTCFKKHDGHFITYRSGNTATQIRLCFIIPRQSRRDIVLASSVHPEPYLSTYWSDLIHQRYYI